MSFSTTQEFFINMKSIPTEDSSEYDAFFENERNKIDYGVTINGVYIHGWLYFHLNHWSINIDVEDKVNHTIKRKFTAPYARDNEWIIAEGLIQAEREKKGAMFFGSRRLGKTEFSASYIGRGATLYKGTQNVICGGNWADIDLITSPLTMGLDNLHEYFRTGRISENLRKEIELGWKDKKGKRVPWSQVKIRNFENGNNTEAAAGITASTFVNDEVGKYNFAACFEAAKPAFTSPFGWRCVPILTGTSGDIKANSDAEKYFNNPEAFNFIMRELPEEGNKKVSVFISGLRRMEGKEKTTFANFVKTEKGILVPDNSELHQIDFYNSNFEKADKIIEEERRQAKLSPDPTALLKATMYYPKNTKELFLTDDGNQFPTEAINEHIAYLQANKDLQGRPVKLFRNTQGKVCFTYATDKKPIVDFPTKPETDKDAPIVIYEEPAQVTPTYLYIAGADPYNQNESKKGSLGTNYIYKRFYDPISGSYQRSIVASYAARPKLMKDWHENVEMLLELYNAVCMPENEGGTLIQYFDAKNKGHMLADGFNFLKEISPSTTITGRVKGLPATTPVQKYYKALVVSYCNEVIQVGIDEEGKPIERLGIVRIFDIPLLKELAAYTDSGNYDRYIAFGHCLAHEVWADKMYPLINTGIELTEKEKVMPKVIKSPFGLDFSNNPFGISKHSPKNAFGL